MAERKDSWYDRARALAEVLNKELANAELHPVLRANMLSICKEIEALESAWRIVRVDGIARASAEDNARIQARFEEGVVDAPEEEGDASEEGEQPEGDQSEHPEA